MPDIADSSGRVVSPRAWLRRWLVDAEIDRLTRERDNARLSLTELGKQVGYLETQRSRDAMISGLRTQLWQTADALTVARTRARRYAATVAPYRDKLARAAVLVRRLRAELAKTSPTGTPFAEEEPHG